MSDFAGWHVVLVMLLSSAISSVYGQLVSGVGVSNGGVRITAVNPWTGSLAGGTRLHIQGTGFSTNTGEGNRIFIGDIPCDPIPLHSQVSQIACKTRPFLSGVHSTWVGWSENLPVTVIANGKTSVCLASSGCVFRYHYGWYHTPRIYRISPVSVSDGTVISVEGRFHAKPFSFEEVNAPSREVPLASVKVANREAEQQQPQNEPFGQSGSRCALFDPESEEPYGVVERHSSEVREFQCRVTGPREAGGYNLSVALLGTNMMPDREMNMGEAHAQDSTYQAEHSGVSFQLLHVPRIDSVHPTASGTVAGTTLTITGDSFSPNASNVRVTVLGAPCAVQAATIQQVVCVLADPVPQSAAAEQPGARGIDMQLWRGKGHLSLSEFRAEGMRNASDVHWVEAGLAEFPADVQSDMGDEIGPQGRMRGFFRAPVTSNYTFVVASDDASELWVATSEENATAVERVVDFNSWVHPRRFDRVDWQSGHWQNHESQLDRSMRRRAKKISLRGGEFRYVEGVYRSGGGGDNFALGAVVHETHVNRKDQRFAVDEQQFINLDRSTALELHNITVDAGRDGSFRLRLGGKTSRPVSFKASAGAMRAAVRELLSNCEGANGEEGDAAGNTFDCFAGYGVDYRGLADTIDDTGEKCSGWDAFSNREHLADPFLQVVAGLDSNLCRNPWYSSHGPHCLNHNGHTRRCRVPRCGGEDSASSPVVATFEEEEEKGLHFLNAFQDRDGVKPKIDGETAHCGRGSLFLHNSFGMFRNNWFKDPTKGDDHGWPFGTKDFPYMCMAYRIPPGTVVSMLVMHDRRNEGPDTKGTQWKTLTMTNTEVHSSYHEIGDWGVVPDDQWHYTCIHLDHMMDTTDDDHFVVGANHLVRDVIFHTTDQPQSTYARNPLWIDDFSVSKTPRDLAPAPLPDLGGVEAKLSSVERFEQGSSVTWQVALTSTDCRPPDAEFDIVEVDGAPDRVEASRIQDHSSRLEHDVVVGFKGELASFSPYASDQDVRAALSSMPSLGGDVLVHRTGTCQTGHGWMVTMTHVPGDQPQLEASLQVREADAASVSVRTVEDGGLLMGPLSAGYFHVPAASQGIHLFVNDAVASCSSPSVCAHTLDSSLTPTLSTVSQTANGDGVYDLVITGSGFSTAQAGEEVQVTVGGVGCVVSSSTNSRIDCTMTYPFIAAGQYPVVVVVPGKGGCSGSGTFDYPLTIQSMTPTSVNLELSTVITVSGWGFDPVLSNNVVTASGETCAMISVTASELQCRISPGAVRRRSGRNLLATVSLALSVGAASTSTSFDTVSPSTPTISSVTPTSASAGGGQLITIQGSSFSSTAADVSVLIGGHACAVQTSTASQITCTTAPGPVGSVPLLVTVDTAGQASQDYPYELSVASVAPTAVGLGGEVEFALQGTGFVGGTDGTPVLNVEGTEVFVVGLYMAALAHEIHELSLVGEVVNEVQAVAVTSTQQFFQLFVGGVATAVMPKDIDQYVMQAAINDVLTSGTVRVTRISESSFEYSVEFRGEQGDVAMLTGRQCSSASSCSSGGVTVTEQVKGVRPEGHLSLALVSGFKLSNVTTTTLKTQPATNTTPESTVTIRNTTIVNETLWTSVQVPARASVAEMQDALEALRPGVAVSVERHSDRVGVRWRISFVNYEGAQPLPVVDSSGLQSSAEVEIRRAQRGTELPEGTWRVGLGGVWTPHLPLVAGEQQVLDAVTTAFPELHKVQVIAADALPGRFLDREYPRQWAIRVSRADVAGLGADRCTSPLYVDWDPAACPGIAADLFLSHHPWYWPASLPKPEDLSAAAYQEKLQTACDAEARAKNLKPGTCHAPVPAETLPVCGVGSGVNPPCWTERFWQAKVTHLDGSEVVYQRDDSNQPSDTQKGYRAWIRPDLEAELAAQMLQVETTVTGYGSGMHSDRVYTRATEAVECNASAVSSQSMTALMPNMVQFLQTYTDLVDSDWLYRPSATWGHGVYSGGESEAIGVERVYGPMESSGPIAAGFSPSSSSSVRLPHSQAYNGKHYTVDFWLMLHTAGSSNMPVISSMTMTSGYAILIAGSHLEHRQSVAEGGLSVLSTVAPTAGAWTHVAVSFDGRVQRLFLDGLQVNSTVVRGSFQPNMEADTMLGGSCVPGSFDGCDVAGSDWTGFDGALSHVLWYNTSAVSAGAIAGHATAVNETLVADIQVRMGGTKSVCSGTCTVDMSGSRTPAIRSVEPSTAWDQALITVRGRRFSLGSGASVTVGEHPCAVQSSSDNEIICQLQVGASGKRHGTVPVSVFAPEFGAAFAPATISLTSIVSSLSPSVGSVMGGTSLTVQGLGFPSSASSISVSVGGTACEVGIVSSDAIECQMAQRSEAADGDQLPVTVVIADVAAVCELSLLVTTAATPVLSDLAPAVVSDGTALVLTGSNLPSDVPHVAIGDIPCVGVSQHSTQLQCTVGPGAGGVHTISVRFAVGFPKTPYSGCCLQASYNVNVSGVVPATGSVWGGRTLTVSGSGFATVSGGNTVFVGGRKSVVLAVASDSLVIKTPPQGAVQDIRFGLEFHVFRALVACNVVGRSCNSLLPGCYGLSGLSVNAPLLVTPTSGNGAKPEWLVDGDASTVWYSQQGTVSQVIALDVGSAMEVVGVTILWSGKPSADTISVRTASTNCQSFQQLASAGVPASMHHVWDGASTVEFAVQSARYLEVSLHLNQSMEEFRIKDIVVVPASSAAASASVSVLVDGSLSDCTAAASSDCTHSYLHSPTLDRITPAEGVVGDMVNISGTGFDDTNCASHEVSIGAATCTPQACTSMWISCTVGSHTVGEYDVDVIVPGVGSAKSRALRFTYGMSLSAINPVDGGFGGGLAVTVSGSGFNTDSSMNVFSICDAECALASASVSQMACTQGRVYDVPAAVDNLFFTTAVRSGEDDAMEDRVTGTVIPVGGSLRFDKFWDYSTSLKKIFLRFDSFDVAKGANVSQARLIVRAGENRCERTSVISIWAEAADDSAPFMSVRPHSLGSRPVTATSVDWQIEEEWKWIAESEESADISAVIQEVVSRPGWRAGNALTVVLEQQRNHNNNIMGCEILSYETGERFAAKLRLAVTQPAKVQSASHPCSVSVSSAPSVSPSAGVEGVCRGGRQSLVLPADVSASSSQIPPGPDELWKEVFDKPEDVLEWHVAKDLCTRHSSRLCLVDDVLDQQTGLPFFGAQIPKEEGSVVKVPVWRTDRDAAKPHGWIDVSSPVDDDYDCGQDDCPQMGDWHWHWGTQMTDEENVVSTQLIPCCGTAGHRPYMAADGDRDTYWHSGDEHAAELVLDLGENHAMTAGLEIHWGEGFATKYSLSSSLDGAVWTEIMVEAHGNGGTDVVSFSNEPVIRFLKLTMDANAGLDAGYVVHELVVHGCSLEPEFVTSAVVPNGTTPSPLFTAMVSKTPTIASVAPSLGSTAGGTDVTITGSFFTASQANLAVTFGDFPCEIQTASASVITCVTSASGTTNGGKKYVSVASSGHGSSVSSAEATFWYIDAWSARTTWGGESPPTGCGSWLDDQGCTDSVVIPAGQVILLDVSLPRFYLVLIEGTLIFDRTDLSLGANYILVRGGTLQIGTESEPFTHQATITLYGHPKSIELPTFGSKVIACYECTLDIHGTPQVAWTKLSATANAGSTQISVQDSVAWPVGSKIVIATTDFESPWSSHSEVATVSSVSGNGKLIGITDIGVCSNYSNSGQPLNCRRTSSLSYTHVGESRTFDGREVEFRAEVGLLSRNIQIIGDHDARLCPLADTAEDGITKLSCNQFGGQIFLHSPGHESLVARLSNFEIKNAGQAFRLGRYAIHWHMIGNVRESFQRGCSVHHSWNRGTAIHGTNYLRMESNFLYNIFGHAVFIEDGPEEYNQVVDNLGIKVTPSMSLLNTDQTPAVFWIVTGKNYILRNHAVASRRYGIWFRPEISATGTSVNTPDVHPINIPLLEFDGNQAHSNGKYGLRVFDVYMPNEPSVFRNTFVWRNGAVGWTATVIGKVAFDGMVAVQNGHHVFESRATNVDSWDQCYVTNGLFVDDPVGLPLSTSFAAFTDNFGAFEQMGGRMKAGILLPWNEHEEGGMSISNCTFVNFLNPCIRGCAHCGRGGSPVLGDGAFETRFSGMKFVDSPERALFRHPNEAFLYDEDGTLTGSGVQESYYQGGSVIGSSFVGNSVLLPNDGSCTPSAMSTHGTGGVVCHGHVFRRMWFHIREPDEWVGKALCVRMPHQSTINTCQSLQPECNCLPYLKKAWKGNVWLAAVGQRYNLQMDLLVHELADPREWSQQVWATYRMEDFYFTYRFLQWDTVDEWGRPLYWSEIGGVERFPENYFFNETACSSVGCGQLQKRSDYPHTSFDVRGQYVGGMGLPGEVEVPEPGSSNRAWTIEEDADGNGVLHTNHVRGLQSSSSRAYDHRRSTVKIHPCPKQGCWPPPLPPGGLPKEDFSPWSSPQTWANTTAHPANPLNKLETVEVSPGRLEFQVLEAQTWAGEVPSEGEDVWIPSWKQVVLDVTTPVLGRLVVEGVLVINASSVVDLHATWIEVKGGSLIIATTDAKGEVLSPFTGTTSVFLHGTNTKLAPLHGANPRETPEIVLGKEGVPFAPAGLGVMGTLIALGEPTMHSSAPLTEPAVRGDLQVTVDAVVDWAPGSEIVVAPTDFDMHEADVVRIASIARWAETTIITLESALEYDHYAGATESYGTREMRMRARVGLLSKNIVIRGTGEGEAASYKAWNSQQPGAASAAVCGNGICENGEDSVQCSQDCIGPAYEYGATVLVAAYTEDFTYCTREYQCRTGYQRSFSGTAQITNVEMRYYGQNNLRPGILFHNVLNSSSSISHVSLNRGYYRGISIEQSSGVVVRNTVIFRSILPALRVIGGEGNRIEDNLAVVSIFWNTHRGATQGKGLSQAKLNAMIGMFHDGGQATVWHNNVAAGSERAGFSGIGVECGDSQSFTGNEAHSSLSGFWFDPYGLGASGRRCTAVTDMQAWKITEYAVYGEVQAMQRVVIQGLKSADARVGVHIIVGGMDAVSHTRFDSKVVVQDSLIVGHSDNAHCARGNPSLWTCKFYMAWCKHLGLKHRGVFVAQFLSGGNMAPLIKPWFDAGSYAALYGQMELDGVTFARFGQYCSSGPRAGIVDAAVSGLPGGAGAADGWHPVTLRNMETVEVAPEAMAHLDPPNPAWINQADCIDMDCDGPKHALIRDEDGTFIGGDGGSILPRSELFSEGSFFGTEYKDPVNIPPDDPWWYPTVPTVMRTNRAGDLLNLTDSYLRRGFGLARKGCTLEAAWNAWRCADSVQTPNSHRRFIIENMDADHEIRRPSPVALSSASGYTDLLNGCMDHGWCFSYTCLKRLMTFWAVVKMRTEYTVHFTGTNPQKMRLFLPYTPSTEKMLVKIYYQTSLRMQVFVGERRRLLEDMNLHDGRQKAQLVRDGKWTPNDGGTGYIEQLPSLDLPCNVGGEERDALLCLTPSNAHGANRWNRAEGLLEIVMAGHEIDQYIEIEGMPVVTVSMGVSTSVDEFYNVKDSFISNLASLLGVNPSRIAIVDVVAGNARRRNLLSSGATVSFEIEPDPEIAVAASAASVRESAGWLTLTVTRSINVLGSCSVQFEVTSSNSTTAQDGVHFVADAGVLTFEATETTKSINVTVLSEAGHTATDKTLILLLSQPENATLNADTTVVTIHNVHPPAPSAPALGGAATSTSLPLTWTRTPWTDAPSDDMIEVVGWELQCRTPDTSSEWMDVPVLGTATSSLYGGLSAYTRVECRVRVECVGGWSDWSATADGLRTLAVCGDGTRHGTEACDDGDTEDSDGCSGSCTVEIGWSCLVGSGVADSCSNGCGDGRVDAAEACDGGDNDDGDGCSAACTVEGGWTCSPSNSSEPHSLSSCATACGDGYRVATLEGCDDNNTVSGDGCSDSCTVENGAPCAEDAAMLSVCQICGNGLIEGTEVCDEGGSAWACVACGAVRPGWLCTGAPSTCDAGPERPTAPLLVTATYSALTISWAVPEGFGLDIVNYTVEWTNSSGAWGTNSQTVATTSFTTNNLTAATSFSFRVLACHNVGCSPFSSSATYRTLSASTVNSLSSLADGFASAVAGSSAITSLVGSVNVSVEKPPEPPQAPDASSEVGLLNETEVVADLQEQLIDEAAGPPASEFGIEMSEISPLVASEGAGVVLLPAQLVLLSENSTDHTGSRDVISVTWELRASTAVDGTDVAQSTGAFAFAPGQSSAYLVLPLVDNDVLRHPSPDVTFTVVLTSSSGGSTLLAQTSRSVTVTDNEVRPTVAFAADTVTTSDNTELAAALTKSTGVVLGVKVYYSTTDLEAVAGVDYVSVPNGEATIPAGQAAGSAPVTILQGSGTFSVTITAVEAECSPGSGVFQCGAVLGSPSALTVTIVAQSGGPVCGNGVPQETEECDDANKEGGDGCSAVCTVELGYACSDSQTGSSTCTLQSTPSAGQVFVRASTSVAGVSAAEFVGAVRLAFRQGVAGTLSLLTSQVLIESVSRRRAQSSVQVDYRLLVAAEQGTSVASALEAAHADGSLVQSLQQQGLNVTVTLTSAPTVVSAPATSPPGAPPATLPSEEDDGGPRLLVAIVVAIAVVVVGCCCCALVFARRKGLLAKGGGKVADAPNERMSSGATPATVPVQTVPAPAPHAAGANEPADSGRTRREASLEDEDEKVRDKHVAGDTAGPDTVRHRHSSHEARVTPSYDSLRPMVGASWPQLVAALGKAGMASEYVAEDEFVAAFRGIGVQGPEVKALWDAEMGGTFPTVFGAELHLLPVAENLAPGEVDRRLLMLYRFVRYKGDEVDVRRLEKAIAGSGMAKADLDAILSHLRSAESDNATVSFTHLHKTVTDLFVGSAVARSMSAKLPPLGAEGGADLAALQQPRAPSYRDLGGRRDGIAAILVKAAEAAEEQRKQDRANLPDRVDSDHELGNGR